MASIQSLGTGRRELQGELQTSNHFGYPSLLCTSTCLSAWEAYPGDLLDALRHLHAAQQKDRTKQFPVSVVVWKPPPSPWLQEMHISAERELAALRKLHHPSIIVLLDSFKHKTNTVLVIHSPSCACPMCLAAFPCSRSACPQLPSTWRPLMLLS